MAMQRRSHKKSRGGCLQCKRRHIKCDEQRPVCRLCTVSDQTCSFANQPLSKSATAKAHSYRQSATSSDTDIHKEPSPSTPGNSPSNPADVVRPALYVHSQIIDRIGPAFENAINLEHMELLLHSIKSNDLFSLGGDIVAHRKYFVTGHILEISFQNPYLLHQFLAFAARHLVTVHPSKSVSYMHKAIALQTRAVSLFNAFNTPITKETCVPILLFSTVLGHQVLADTLSRRDASNLDIFLMYFVQCLGTLRGVYVIFEEAKPFWQESVLERILSLSSSFTSRDPVGTRCQGVKELVAASSNLSPNEKEACRVAIRYLQVGFDAVLAEQEQPGDKYQMLFLWCVVAPREFIALVSAKNTEALIVLGHYAMLLRYGKAMWQVRDAGDYILGLLRSELDEKVLWDWTC